MKDIKRIYLILVVIVSILAVTLLSTKALFVNVTENDNNVTLETGLNYTFTINGEQQFTIPANSSLTFSANATNDTDGAIYYEIYYSMISPTTLPSGVTISEITDSSLTTSGNLEKDESKKIPIVIINDSSESITLKIGLAAGYVGNEINYLGNETLITSKTATSLAPEETWSGKGGSTITIDDCEKTTTIGTVNGVTQVVENFMCPTVVANGADTSGANMPNLYDGMIPIKWDSSNNVVKADVTNPTDNAWYNYTDKQWANAVMVSSSTRDTYMDAEVGTTIATGDILAYWVWIPRYSYQLFNTGFTSGTSAQQIEIVFESASTEKSKGTTNGEMYTHPAFSFGTEEEEGYTELSGFWVAKFEPSGTAVAGSLTVLPGVASLRSITVGNAYTASQQFANTAYLTEAGINQVDARMMKNTEWGAVAYLSHSIYGKNAEITINNNGTTYYTGGGTGTSYITNVAQSTTGTMYGVYDMSGNAFEYVMGNYASTTGSSGLTVTGINGKYVDIYTGDSVGNSIMGDAVGETAGWYEDYSYFINSSSPWFLRGGSYANDTKAGVFVFYRSNGNVHENNTFRPVLSAK